MAEGNAPEGKQRLRPLAVTRVANAAPGLVLGALCINVWLENEPVPSWLVWSGLVLAAYATVRAPLMGVDIDDERLRVRGQLWSRSIPRAQVVAVRDGLPARIIWSPDGRSRRWTPLIAFSTPPQSMATFAAHNRDMLRRIRLASGRRR